MPSKEYIEGKAQPLIARKLYQRICDLAGKEGRTKQKMVELVVEKGLEAYEAVYEA